MEQLKIMPRILLAGVNSGCGKTSITCGILKALKDRGINIQPYKCGPDYIDPMLHSHIAGTECRNLDPFFSTGDDLRFLVGKDSQKADFSVIEGVMGYYDGIGISCEKSTWTVSKETETPVILIVNGKGMSHTLIPVIKGMKEYRENSIAGIIINRCSRGLYEMIKPQMEKETGVPVVGYFPQKEGISIGSRHLGLMTAEEIENLDEIISLLGKTAEEGIDLDLLLKIGREAVPLAVTKPPEILEKKVNIAVARDRAFCFYYKENLDILEQLGARIVFFSPIKDTSLPENTDGIYLGGGYPEIYKKELSSNEAMKESIRRAVMEGKPLIAECGGFMYACDHLIDVDGESFEMLRLLDTDVSMTQKLSMEFGYVTLTAQKDTSFFEKGAKIRAHEFHYSRAEHRGATCTIRKASGKSWEGLYVKENVMAGYPHFYFHNCREIAQNFVNLAEQTKRKWIQENGKEWN
ncbi:MAG: cobyrinate a,c-diamide synthase [Eubacterium sp.]|nr:cobyrinate a,c-diamide synthase [Eubacterium sp.]MDD7208498.1 cobyrinate a,c-diamide synthase [Lachnospiraceae bacterium]MDY5497621.1 cobyrinate a,c-diamide synthase [Anaerobutyricum sp.]